MKKTKKSPEEAQQQALGVLHTQQQNFFYENISQKLKKYAENQEKVLNLFLSI